MTNTTHTAKHTPGPWVVDEVYEDDEQRCIGIVKEGQGYIAGIHILASADTDNTEFTAEDEANATLIAAAPAMYEALSSILKDIEKVEPRTLSGYANLCAMFRTVAKAALAQAEGRG